MPNTKVSCKMSSSVSFSVHHTVCFNESDKMNCFRHLRLDYWPLPTSAPAALTYNKRYKATKQQTSTDSIVWTMFCRFWKNIWIKIVPCNRRLTQDEMENKSSPIGKTCTSEQIRLHLPRRIVESKSISLKSCPIEVYRLTEFERPLIYSLY